MLARKNKLKRDADVKQLNSNLIVNSNTALNDPTIMNVQHDKTKLIDAVGPGTRATGAMPIGINTRKLLYFFLWLMYYIII